ncbi:MAG: hypothetical protein JO165_02775 [Candidatus Eremiobacteraeota bacterium]|nr:hypothetical protein [Candidatus Eremiobacteraeota bacterium]
MKIIAALSRAVRTCRRAHFTALLIVPLLCGAAPQNATPQAVFLRCEDAVNALSMPAFIGFTLEDASIRAHGIEREILRIVARTADAHAYVRTIRSIKGGPIAPDPRVETGDVMQGTLIYRPADFPLADFGLRRTHVRPGIFEASGTPQPLPQDLKQIAGVRSVYVPYDIEDLGATTIDGRPVYHFRLRPKRDAGHNILREIWIDEETYLPRRYVAERFVDAGIVPFRYLVTVNAAVIDGHLVNLDADGRFNVNRALLLHFSGEGNWKISDISFPKSPPAWLFDPSSFSLHKSDAPVF